MPDVEGEGLMKVNFWIMVGVLFLGLVISLGITDSCANSATFVSIRGWRTNTLIERSESGDASKPCAWTNWAGWKSILR